MNTPVPTNRYKYHRFPAEIISHAVWLYFRFCLSYRDVEELLFARGVTVTYEAIRKWCRKFGQAYANQLGSDVHVMLALHRSFHQVVMTDGHFDGTNMIGEFLGER
jgi:transposase-like protein